MSPRKNLSEWQKVSGEWKATPDGAIEGKSSKEGMMLLYKDRYDDKLEFSGEFEFTADKGADSNAGLIIRYRPSEDKDYSTVVFFKNKKTLSIQQGFSEKKTEISVSNLKEHNRFLLRMWKNNLQVYLNGTLVGKASTSTLYPVMKGTIGLGGVGQTPGSVVRFRHLRVRLLTKKFVV